MALENINFSPTQPKQSTLVSAGITGIPNSLIDAAKARLIQLLKEQSPDLEIHPDEIILENFKHVMWPDSSIGCPKEGSYYLSVLTPGYSIGLQVGNHHYRIHTDANGDLMASPDFPTHG